MNAIEYHEKMLEILKGSCPSYEAVLKAIYSTSKVGLEFGDINVFIPVQGRHAFLASCVDYLKAAGDKAGLKLNIVVIENDNAPSMYDRANELNLSYIFIPSQISFSDGAFAKSLCYNIGFLKTKRAKWNLLFGSDYLVEDNFFERSLYHLSNNTNWLQPYRGHSLRALGPRETDRVVSSPRVMLADLEDLSTLALKPAGPIFVKDTDFIEVGGFDPEYFINSSFADTFFWAKLEQKYNNNPAEISSHMAEGATFANDPPINIYHLYHPPVISSIVEAMHSTLHVFYKLDGRKRQHIIGIKKLIFNQAMNIRGI